MYTILWVLVPFGLVLTIVLVASFVVTQRMPRTLFHTSAEYGLVSEEVFFDTADGLRLHGCWIPAPDSSRAVIILHGHGGSLDWDLHRAPAFHEAGFNVFLFDFRAHGRSQGKLATFGYLERYDVLGAIEYIKRRGVRSIGLMGFSYGAIASILTAAISSDVRAVVADGGPSRLRVALTARVEEKHIPRWLAASLTWLTVSVVSVRLSANLFKFEPVRWVGEISPRPILFIHGELDQYCRDFDELFDAARKPKEVWRLPDVGHTKASEIYPEEFRKRVIEFFDHYL